MYFSPRGPPAARREVLMYAGVAIRQSPTGVFRRFFPRERGIPERSWSWHGHSEQFWAYSPVFNRLREIRSSFRTFSSPRRPRGAFLFPFFRAPALEFARFARPHPGNGPRRALPPAPANRVPEVFRGRARTQENCRFCGENCCISVDQRSPSGAASGMPDVHLTQ